MLSAITKYEYGMITIKLDTGGEIKLNMEGEYLAYYGSGCDLEIPFSSDDLKDIFFMTCGHCRTALSVVQWAQSNHESIRRQTLQDDADEADYIREVSSPFLSGRI